MSQPIAANRINDYNSLQGAIADELYRLDSPQIAQQAQLFITLAEAAIRRDQEWFTQTYSLANSGNPLAVTANPTQLPPNVKQITYMWAATGTYHHEIEIIPISEWRALSQTNLDAAGVPTKAVLIPEIMTAGGFLDNVSVNPQVTNGPLLFLWPQPAGLTGGFAVDFQYVADVPELSPLNVSTPLLRRHPDLYLYGSLIHSAPFLQADDRIQIWQTLYDKAIMGVNREVERAKFSGNPKRPRFRALQ